MHPATSLGTMAHPDLAVRTPDVGLDRVDAEEALGGDLLVGPTLDDQGQHLRLPARDSKLLAGKGCIVGSAHGWDVVQGPVDGRGNHFDQLRGGHAEGDDGCRAAL